MPVAAFDLPHPVQEGLPADELAASKPETGEAGETAHGSVEQIAEVRLAAPEQLGRFPRSQNLGCDLKLLFFHASKDTAEQIPAKLPLPRGSGNRLQLAREKELRQVS